MNFRNARWSSRPAASCPPITRARRPSSTRATASYYGLNRVGARIWELVQDPRSIGAIRDAIVAEYEVEPDRCERDVLELLGRLSEAGLIEPAGERG